MPTNQVLQKEAAFHDAVASKIQVTEELARYHLSFDSPTSYIGNRLPRLKHAALHSIGDPKGKRILVYGCGNDSASVWFSKLGGVVDAIDISPKSVENQQEIAHILGLEIKCMVMDAHRLDLASDEYDLVFGNAILHHLDLSEATPEIARVLKPGGRAIFRDVLRGNIFLQAFRSVTPFSRTSDEHPLTKRDLSLLAQHFATCEVTEYILSGQPYFMVARVINNAIFRKMRVKLRIPTNDSIYAAFDRLDASIFRYFPIMRSQAWLCLIILSK